MAKNICPNQFIPKPKQAFISDLKAFLLNI